MSQILLVEDEFDIQQIYATVLQESGYKVDQATDGVEAIGLLKAKTPYQLILLDIVMPKTNGLEILDFLKNTPNAHTPVVILSNLDQDQVIHNALAQGVKEYIIKTDILPSDLITLVKKYLPAS